MTKKLSRWLVVIALALLTTSYAKATTVSEPCGSVNAGPGVNPTLSGALFTCAAFAVPSGDTLTSVGMLIGNGFSAGIAGQTNTLQFTYSGSGFDAVTGLTTTSTSTAISGSDGETSDLGGVVAEVPGSTCSETGPTTVECFEVTPVPTSFSMTVSCSWLAGGTTDVGSDGVTIDAIFTYVPTATPPLPEPSSLVLLGSGLLVLGYFARAKRKSNLSGFAV